MITSDDVNNHDGDDSKFGATTTLQQAKSMRRSVTGEDALPILRRALTVRVAGSPVTSQTLQPQKEKGFIQKLISQQKDHRLHAASVTSHRFQRIVRSNRFNLVIGVMILANAVCLGIETDSQDRDAVVWVVLEVFFTFSFSIELSLRFLVYGRSMFWNTVEQRVDAWNIFDAFLVFVSIIDLLITVIGQGNDSMDMMTSLRACRLLRLARIVRLLRVFREMWLFVCGVFAALNAVVWAFAVIALIIFISSTFIVRTLGYRYGNIDSVDYDARIAAKFRDVPTAAMTLFQVITLDNWMVEVAEPVLSKVPGMAIFFVLFIGFCAYALVAVIVAIITEEVTSEAKAHELESRNQQERELRVAVSQIHQVFLHADADGNGLLSREEFYECLRDPSVSDWLQKTDVSMVDAEGMFDIVDHDESGFLTANEFIEGCLRGRGPARARDILELECDIMRYTRTLKESVRVLEEKMENRDRELIRSLHQLDQKMLCIVKATAMVNPTVSAWMSPLWDEDGATRL